MKNRRNTSLVQSAPQAAALILTFFILALAGCTYYLAPGEEATPVSVIESSVAYDISVTLTGAVKTQPYYAGDTLTISWEGAAAAGSFNIDLYRGEDFCTAVASAFSKAAVFVWTIPESLPPDETYRIKVTCISDSKSEDIYGYSGYFAVGVKPDSGLSDVTVSETVITITLIDNGSLVDGDTVTVSLNGAVIADQHVLAGAPGTVLNLTLAGGANTLEVYAVNEGEVSPNTAQLVISHVTAGEAVQQWRLYAGETGSLTISAP